MLNWYVQKKTDIYIKHYSMLKFEIMKINDKRWEVYYMIRYMDAQRPIYMMLSRSKTKQQAVARLDEIEDYVADDTKILKPINMPQIHNVIATMGAPLDMEYSEPWHICLNGMPRLGRLENCPYYPSDKR